ncbi:MAG: hypothetical protein LBJ14_06050 [Desulfarculales bacterium]|jgi:hypothetical protein|nr:hypothetical protein [Desulfarculales bacterium]
MKKIFPFLLILLLAFVPLSGCSTIAERFSAVSNWWGGSGDVDTNLTKRVVVVPFSHAQPSLAAQAKALQNAVEESLAAQSNISMLTFRDLQKASIEYGATELVLENRYLIGARYLGVNLVVMGQISSLSVEYDLEGIYGFRNSVPRLIMEGQLRLVDVLSATMVGYQNFRESVELDDVQAQGILTGNAPEPEQVEELIAAIIENNAAWPLAQTAKVPWSGMVLQVRDSQALVSVGADTGFNAGDSLILYSRSTPISSGAGHDVYLRGEAIGTVTLNQIMEHNSWGEAVFNRPAAPAEDENGPAAPGGQNNKYVLETGQMILTR